jgi:hypothetical protein
MVAIFSSESSVTSWHTIRGSRGKYTNQVVSWKAGARALKNGGSAICGTDRREGRAEARRPFICAPHRNRTHLHQDETNDSVLYSERRPRRSGDRWHRQGQINRSGDKKRKENLHIDLSKSVGFPVTELQQKISTQGLAEPEADDVSRGTACPIFTAALQTDPNTESAAISYPAIALTLLTSRIEIRRVRISIKTWAILFAVFLSCLSPCKIWSFHGSDYEECRLLGYKTPVRTSQETHYVSATDTSQLMLCKI